MRALRKCAVVNLVGLMMSLPAAFDTGVALAEETTLKLSYPKKIEDLSFKELREPGDETRSTQLVYKAPGMTLTLYIYGGGADLTDGVDSLVFTREFESAKKAIQDPRAWKRAKQVHEGTVHLGVAPFLVAAREAIFNVKSEDMKGTSYLYLAAANRVFFKIRYTASGVQRESEERNIAAIREATGEIIRNATQPAPAKRPASTPEDRAKAVRLARELEADPMSDDAVDKRRWLIEWYEAVPDITITVCNLLGPFPKEDHPFFPQVLTQSMFSGGAFMIEHPDQAKDQVAVQTAGMIGALTVYESFAKVLPGHRLPFLDNLVKQRDEGTLAAHMPEAVKEGCQ